jgi:site-specific recombinase XerC
MRAELEDFVHHCVERRLAPLTCSAYERDVGACLAYVVSEGVRAWADVRVSARTADSVADAMFALSSPSRRDPLS